MLIANSQRNPSSRQQVKSGGQGGMIPVRATN
jgi:hypothetical protein